jgi:hypothetical protein
MSALEINQLLRQRFRADPQTYLLPYILNAQSDNESPQETQ